MSQVEDKYKHLSYSPCYNYVRHTMPDNNFEDEAPDEYKDYLDIERELRGE